MTAERYRPDWEDLVTRAKAAQGRWVLGLQAAPVRVLETANRRSSNRWLNDPDGRLYAMPAERATTADGEEICDVYVRWEWFNPAHAPKIPITPAEFRTLRLPRELKVRLNEYAAATHRDQSDIINEVLKKYVRYGTRAKPVPQASEQQRATVPEELWTNALLRAEKDGMPLVEIVRYELARKLR